MNIIVVNNKNAAFNAKLFVKHQSDIDFIAANGVSNCKTNVGLVECDLGNPYVQDSISNITMTFNLHKLRPSLHHDFIICTNTTSKRIERKPTILPYMVESVSELVISAHSEPDIVDLNDVLVTDNQQVAYLEDIGPMVKHVYTVRNIGPSPVHELVLLIQWPYQSIRNEPLLYLLNVPTIVVDGIEDANAYCEPNDAINPKHLVAKDGKRDDEDNQLHEIETQSSLRFTKRSVTPEEIVTLSPKVS